jgi:glycosyltransferase involved in cell wall biosynthesis
MSEPKVSVVITCYNYARFLPACIDSVLRQSYRNREIILVDDGSTDETPAVARRFLGHADFRYFRQENAGQARAKNAGIRLATGEIIAFLDADDFWAPEKLRLQVPLFAKNETAVVFSRMHGVDAEGRPLPAREPEYYLRPRRGCVTPWLFFDNFVPFSSVLVRRRCLEAGEPFDPSLSMGIDWNLWLRLSARWDFDYVDAPLLFYRTGHADQMSRQLELRQQCADRIRDRFLVEYPELLPARLIRRALSHSYCCRGYYYRHLDKRKSLAHYLTAIRYRIFTLAAYRGMVRTLVSQAPANGR